MSTERVQIFRDVVARVKEAVAAEEANFLADEALKYKRVKMELQMREHEFREKLHELRERLYDDKILMMNLTTLSSEVAACFELQKEEIRCKRRQAPLNE